MIDVGFINKPERIYEDGGSSTVNLNQVPVFDEEQYDLSDEKDFKYFISDLERIVRNSFEYRWMMNYLKNTEGMDECAVLENVTSRNDSKVRIEIHHSPLTLYDICLAVIRKRQANHEDMNINACANEIMYDHFSKYIGLIPLCSTVHEMVHNSFFFIPTDRTYGDYKQFINSYYDYIAPEVLDSIDNAEQATKDYDGSQMEVFNNHKIYIDSQCYDIDKFMETKQPIKDRIEEIKNGNQIMAPGVREPKIMCKIINKP